LEQKPLYATDATLHKIRDILRLEIGRSELKDLISGLWLRCITIPRNNSFVTYQYFITVNDKQVIANIIQYANTEVVTWLGALVKEDGTIHISVSYNLTDEVINQQFDQLFLILELQNLRDFQKIECGPSDDKKGTSDLGNQNTDVLELDISLIREYNVPQTERKEHFRWQLCGPGRSILRHVRVRKTIVRQHTKKGKRIQ
jgi:hypothetical protein